LAVALVVLAVLVARRDLLVVPLVLGLVVLGLLGPELLARHHLRLVGGHERRPRGLVPAMVATTALRADRADRGAPARARRRGAGSRRGRRGSRRTTRGGGAGGRAAARRRARWPAPRGSPSRGCRGRPWPPRAPRGPGRRAP